MCGIIAYSGPNNAANIITKGLGKLEYRGYDSVGVAVHERTGKRAGIEIVKGLKGVHQLKHDLKGNVGIGHTRWATNGKVSIDNAHPHISSDGAIVLVHNGIVENSEELKTVLIERGYKFYTETDTEVLANLIAWYFTTFDFKQSVHLALSQIKGNYSVAVLNADSKELIGACKGLPLILVAAKNNGVCLASDISAFHDVQSAIFLKDSDLVHVKADTSWVIWNKGKQMDRVFEPVKITSTDLGDYKHFMEKEIFEQPYVLQQTLLAPIPKEIIEAKHITLVGCGSAYNAALACKYIIEGADYGVTVRAEYASEFRWVEPVPGNAVFIAFTQSGETIDTINAVNKAKEKGYKVFAVCNNVHSTISRLCPVIYQNVGIEVSVASTKAFTSMVLIGILISRAIESYSDIRDVDLVVQRVLNIWYRIKDVAEKYKNSKAMMFLGAGEFYPIALEGALKVKEVSYIHAQAHPRGELKHGHIALIDKEVPTVIVTGECLQDKTQHTINEINARGGNVVVIAPEACAFKGVEFIPVPNCGILTPIACTVALQLLSYYLACYKGVNVDRPRNLAKSVTVE